MGKKVNSNKDAWEIGIHSKKKKKKKKKEAANCGFLDLILSPFKNSNEL